MIVLERLHLLILDTKIYRTGLLAIDIDLGIIDMPDQSKIVV